MLVMTSLFLPSQTIGLKINIIWVIKYSKVEVNYNDEVFKIFCFILRYFHYIYIHNIS